MLVSTKAIVLAKLKYNDNDLIIKCYTEDFGVKSYLLKNALKSKKSKLKPAYFQLLSIIDIEADHNEKRSLQYLKEVKLHTPLNSIHTDIVKSTIVIFLSEVISNILKEEEKNNELYNFLETSIIWFDSHDRYVNFHYVFLMELTKYLGFYPSLVNFNSAYFNLSEGKFSNSEIGNYCISNENLITFKALLGIKFDVDKKLQLNGVEKRELLNLIILYFQLHLDGFKKPKSLAVLNEVFK